MTSDLKLSIQGDTFAEMKNQFDLTLAETLKNMQEKETEKATITVKVEIALTPSTEPLPFSNDEVDIMVPTFKHEVSSVMQVKTKMDGYVGGKMKLVKCAGSNEHVLREIRDAQMRFDEDGIIHDGFGYSSEPIGNFSDVSEEDANDDSGEEDNIIDESSWDLSEDYDYDDPED